MPQLPRRFSLARWYARLPVKVRAGLRAMLPDRLLRWWAHRQSDVYLISYPKCGRTWLRLMMGRAISQHYQLGESEDVLLLRTNRRYHPALPRITVVHQDRPMYKTPAELERDKRRFASKKVILLARDPRDVIVSHYFEMTSRARLFGDNPYEAHAGGFEGTLPEFIRAERGGYDTLLEYYNIWADNRHIPRDFLLVRYEDLRKDPAGELRRVLDFLGLAQINAEEVAEAVAYASFENMRKMEAQGRFGSGMLRPGDQNNRESFKTRKGKVQGFVDYLDADDIQALNHKTRHNLNAYYGYFVSETQESEQEKR